MKSLRLGFGSISLTTLIVLAACGQGEVNAPEEHEYIFDADNARELGRSAIQEPDTSIARVGIRWDAPEGSDLDIQFSLDGDRWTPWQPVVKTFAEPSQDARTWALAGHADTPIDSPRYYRLRSPVELQFAAIDVLPVVPEAEGDSQADAGSPPPLDADGGRSQQKLTIGGVFVNPRSAWSARASRCTSNTSFYRITIHHTVGPNNDSLSPAARMRQMQNYHMDSLGWCDIGYHYVVSQDGALWEARPSPRLGAHVGGANTGNIGISFMGNYMTVAATNAQLNSAAELMVGLSAQNRISLDRGAVRGHREYSATACPGDLLYAQLPDLLARANNGGGAPPATSTIIVDSNNAQNDARVAEISVSSSWTSSTSVSGYYGTGYWWNRTAPMSDPAVFSFFLASDETRTVDAWWAAAGDRSSAAPFLIFNADGQQLGLVTVDQRSSGGSWNTLGTFPFTAGWNSVQLSIWAPESQVVIADAIRVR
ncbi:MAG: N-acetylmuramoyl-L-alanine amidase [Myxococcota bacterium]